MRRVWALLSVVVLAMTGFASAALAQGAATPVAEPPVAESAFARGMNQPAVLYTERGDMIATLTITDIERDWADYDEFYAPGAGYEYVAVTFDVTMQSRGNLEVGPYSFTLFDGFGLMNSPSWVSPAAGVESTVLESEETVASGETGTFTVIFEVYGDAPLAILTWQPNFSTAVMIDISDAD